MINKDNVLDVSWNNESMFQIRIALQELLTALGDSIEVAEGGRPAELNLSVEGTVLTVTVTLADGETKLSSSVDLAGAISAAQVAVEIVNNLYTNISSKALSAAMGLELDRASGTVLRHMHWVAGAAHASLSVGAHARYFEPELNKIYHFYGYTPPGQGQPELGLDVYTPPASVIFYDIETGSCYRFDGLNMVDILSSKANASEVVKSISVNGGQAQTPNNGNVNINAVKSVTINGNTTQVDNNGNVNLGTVQGEKGDKGETGDVQVDGNGNVLIYNGLDKTTTGAALDASQGQFIGKLLNTNDDTFYNVWVGTAAELEALNGDYDDNTIYLVGTIPQAVTRYSIGKTGIGSNINPSGDDAAKTQIAEGSSFELILSPASDYTIDSATGTMEGGGTLIKTNNQDGSVTFSTNAVTGNITISAIATKHIIGITVSDGTKTGNSIQMAATVNPADADNVTLEWSISEDGTNYSNSTTHFGINSSGVLTIKEGANNASVTVRCADTNASSDTASGTLQLTGLTYDNTIPTTEITDIATQRTGANTLQLSAVADGNTHTTPTFALSGQVPTVKQVRRWDAGDEVDGETMAEAGHDLIDVPAVVLNNDNTLTYKGDCEVQVTATAQVDGSTISKSKTITITHDSADAIWFEDEMTLAALNNNSVGSGGKVTYAQAAAVTVLTGLAGNTDIMRFNEFQWFTGITNIGTGNSHKAHFKGCSSLEAIQIPSTVTELYGSAGSTPFGGTKVESLSFGSILIGAQSLGGALYLKSVTINSMSSIAEGFASGSTSLQSLKLGRSSSYTLPDSIFKDISSLQELDLGAGISSLPYRCCRGCTSLEKLTLRYEGKVTLGDQALYGISSGKIDLYVPSANVGDYPSTPSDYDASIKSINAITE